MGCLLLLNPYLWNANGGYIGRAVESNGAFYDTGREVWDLLEQTGIEHWEVNEAYLQVYHERGFSFEFSSQDMKAEDWKKEIEAIQALQRGNVSAALDAANRTPKKGLTYRLQEVQWLFKNGYRFDEIGDKLIFYIP